MQNPPVTPEAPAPPEPTASQAAQGTPAPEPAPIVSVTTDEGGRPVVVQLPGPSRPMTADEVRALELRRSELMDQLNGAQRGRREVAAELSAADPAARGGLEQRLKVIDDRIVQIEAAITENGQQLTSLPANLAMAAQRQASAERAAASNDEEEMFFGGLFLGFAMMGTWMWIRRFRNRGRRRELETIGGARSEQFLRLEQAVDAIAVEVERIAEGQRFTAKLMAETHDRARRDAVAKDAAGGY